MEITILIGSLSDALASVILSVDTRAEHDRWQEDISPFDEERHIKMLQEAVERDVL